jgi:hypothetical protein
MENSGNQIEKEEIVTESGYIISSLEAKRIREAINKTDTEKFHLFCRMMRIQSMLESAIVTHK